MYQISIILFFLYCWGLGLGLGRFVKESEDFLERNLMRLGIGLGSIIALGLIFNLIKIPLDWRIFLFISIIPILILIVKNFRKGTIFLGQFSDFKINIYSLIMLVLFFISFYMYGQGAFSYPYLEDEDSWSHALGVKYVSIEKTVFAGIKNPFHYIDPYPPAYDLILGIMHQTNDSVYWTLKFFNALIISLSIIFFYFFVKVFTNNSKKALFATFALFAVPAFLSHFIWAIALTMPLFFVSFYSVEKIKDDKKWWIIAAIVIAVTITSSPTHSTYFGLFFIIYFIARLIAEKKFLIYEFFAGFFGFLLSSIFWWLPMFLKYGFRGTLSGLGLYRGTSLISVGGTGDRSYTLSDFLCQPGTGCWRGENMVNNPIGIGIVLSILTVIGFIFLILKYKSILKKENYYKLVTVLWFIFALYAVNAAKFPVKLSPFRAWMLLAIPVALLSGEAINLINNLVKAFVKNITGSNKIVMMVASIILLGLITYGIIMTSFVQKYAVNTSPSWPPGAFWTSNEEIQGYIWFKDNIPPETKVFTFSNNALVIGFDKFICHWCDDINQFKKIGFEKNVDEIYSFLNSRNYKYLIIDGQFVKKVGLNTTNELTQKLVNSGSFQPVFQNNGMVLLRIV